MNAEAKSFIPEHEIRSRFARALSDMYGEEVPLYKTLVETVREVNEDFLIRNPDLEQKLGSLSRVSEERHGAIRVGTPAEMKGVAQLFAVMGMHPVDYYDLTVSKLPIHSTAFRPITEDELAANPFRVFTSLLRMDIIREKSPEIADIAEELLGKRKIFSDGLLELVEIKRKQRGLTEEQTAKFIIEALKTFRWHKEAAVSEEIYNRLLKFDSLLADIAGFQGPHINHLTPRVLDIDALYKRMGEKEVKMISAIQGPPELAAPPLLRQTSFQAIQESTLFFGENGEIIPGKHRARFGEVEARGIALTPRGRELYDGMLARVEAQIKQNDPAYKEILQREFAAFPRSYDELREQGLAYFTYVVDDEKKEVNKAALPKDLHGLIKAGYVKAIPITYEDFLPVSAAGIFKSNLIDGGSAEVKQTQSGAKADLEAAIESKIINPFALYAAIQAKSLRKLPKELASKELRVVYSAIEQQALRYAVSQDPVNALYAPKEGKK